MRPALLIGDIGGTNARLALVWGGEVLAQQTYATRALSGLGEGVSLLLSEAGREAPV